MIRKFSTIITITTLILVSYGLIIVLKNEDDRVCDELVIMNDGSQIEATSVSSYENGMSAIKTCEGEQMDTPTINIKMVKHIEK